MTGSAVRLNCAFLVSLLIACGSPKLEPTPHQQSSAVQLEPSASSRPAVSARSKTTPPARKKFRCSSASDCPSHQRCCEDGEDGGVCQAELCRGHERCVVKEPICSPGFLCFDIGDGSNGVCLFTLKHVPCDNQVCGGDTPLCVADPDQPAWFCSTPPAAYPIGFECASDVHCGPGYHCCVTKGQTSCVGPGGCDFLGGQSLPCATDIDCPGAVTFHADKSADLVLDHCEPIDFAPPGFGSCQPRP